MAQAGELIEFPGAQLGRSLPDLQRLLRPAAEGRGFSGARISDAVLEELVALMAVGPGMTGASPTRLLFVSSPGARTRLAPHLAPRTRDMAVLAPACAILGYDRGFAEQLIAFAGDGVAGVSSFERPGRLRAAAMRNSVLQGAYLVLSARALGLEALFLQGYDGKAVSTEFFRDPDLSAIYVAALGYPAQPTPEPMR